VTETTAKAWRRFSRKTVPTPTHTIWLSAPWLITVMAIPRSGLRRRCPARSFPLRHGPGLPLAVVGPLRPAARPHRGPAPLRPANLRPT
jgi:hypothetical protein